MHMSQVCACMHEAYTCIHGQKLKPRNCNQNSKSNATSHASNLKAINLNYKRNIKAIKHEGKKKKNKNVRDKVRTSPQTLKFF